MAIDLSGVYYELENLSCDCDESAWAGEVRDEVGDMLHKTRMATYDEALDGTLQEILERLERIMG